MIDDPPFPDDAGQKLREISVQVAREAYRQAQQSAHAAAMLNITQQQDALALIDSVVVEKADGAAQPSVYTGLLLQTAVIADRGVDNGRLVHAVALPWFDLIRAIEKDHNLAFQIPPETWEEIVAGAYKADGWDEVIVTRRSGDYGRDVIATKRGFGTVRVIDQVKAYGLGNLVTANDARALLGVLQGDPASKGFLTTTSDFAPRLADDPLIKPWLGSKLELVNGERLFDMLADIAARKKR